VLFILLIVGTLIAAVIWMGGDTLEAKLSPGYGTSRGEIWRASWRVVKENPWTGVGFGTFFLAVPQYQIDPGLVKLEAAHNDYIDLAASGGVVALGLAGWFIAMMIWRTRSALRSRDAYRRAAALGATAGILGIGVHSLVDFGLQITGISVVFAALVVIAVADGRVESASISGKRKRKSLPYRKTARGSFGKAG
jgi:O-antigen ligase